MVLHDSRCVFSGEFDDVRARVSKCGSAAPI
jgi:hypothetical protein